MSTVRFGVFGSLLKQARVDAGLSQVQAAHRVGIHPTQLGTAERGVKLMSLERFIGLWALLEFDIDTVIQALHVPLRRPQRGQRRVQLKASGAETGKYYTFGRSLGLLRQAAQVTQRELGDVIGCSGRHIMRIEHGHGLPSLHQFAQLHQSLGFDVRSMLAFVSDAAESERFHGFGRQIKDARVRRSLSPIQVAREAGLELQYYQHIESGNMLPTMQTAIMLHRVIEFDANAAIRWGWQSGAVQSSSAETTI